MPVVRFTRDFDWKPVPAVTVAYLAGMEQMVTTRCAEKAMAQGKAVKVDRRRRKKAAHGKDVVGG